MHILRTVALAIFFLLSCAPISMPAQERDRSQIPAQYQWDLTAIYPSASAWQEARQKFSGELPAIGKYEGTLAMSADRLSACLDLLDRLNRQFTRLFTYANLNLDQDMRLPSSQALKQELDQLGAAFAEQTAFIDPEILAIDPARLQSFLYGAGKLETYRHYLHDLLRRQAHTGNMDEKKIIAAAGLIADAPANIRDALVNMDFPYPEVTGSDGKMVKLDPSGFARQRRSANREDRKKAYSTYMGKLNEFSATFGALLNAQITKDIFYMKAGKYGSCLESSLDEDNIPVQVFHSLVENVNRNLPTFHRYLKLRQRILGVDRLHYYDLSAPLAVAADRQFTFAEAREHILAACRPLGNNYVSVARKAFADRWIDAYPTAGKRPGGYANGWAYDVHPYILFNFGGGYDDMSGLAHELGHALQSYLSNRNQPFATAQCPRFVTEVASTLNEALLADSLLKQTRDDDVRLSMLCNYLDGFAIKIFRATQISEFEFRAHEMAEKGEPLTGDALNRLYLEIARKYYGHDQNVCIVDDAIQSDWTTIPQLYYDFYAYQYATAYSASTALSELVLNGGKAVQKKYLDFLSSGGSDYSIPLLKKAGVDMTAPEPFDLCMAKMNRALDEMEKILDKKN
jgi:oligoendopeptidase F